MPEILLSRQTITARTALLQCQSEGGMISDRLMSNSHTIRPNTPYLISDQPTQQDWNIANELYAGNSARNLAELSAELGGENVVALSILQERIENFSVSLAGAGASTFNGRVGHFEEALGNYQRALLSYREASRSGSPLMVPKRMQARQAFERLQTAFQSELRAITAEVRARRGTPLTNVNRALNIARDSRHADKLYVQNHAQAQQLVRFSSHAKLLSNGLAVIDFGSRAGQIHTTYRGGGDWHREMFVQSSSFALSAAAATITVSAGVVGLALLMALTPVGWVGLVAAGGVVALGAAGSAMAVDQYVQSRADRWYDTILEWLAI